MLIAQETNHSITLLNGVARCTVWRVPEITHDEGARMASLILERFCELASAEHVTAGILDLRRAPPAGPKTQAFFAQMFATWEAAERPLFVVITDPLMRHIQSQLLELNAPDFGEVVDSDTEALERLIRAPR